MFCRLSLFLQSENESCLVVNLGETSVKIDVVIPSVRPEELDFLALLGIKVPRDMYLHFYIIIDSPGYAEFEAVIDDNRKMTVRTNPSNIGAAASRNRGLDLCDGDYVLFMDDDVVPENDLIIAYHNKITENPDCSGFVGRTKFPEPVNIFTSGVLESNILTFFDISATRKNLLWGTTSNLLLRRNVIGDFRFKTIFPKAGGGEDIDFCLNVLKEGKDYLVTVPEAVVWHGWWNGGRVSYRRFFRWAYGDSVLPELHPKFKYRNYPNMVEAMAIVIPLIVVISYSTGISLTVIPLFLGMSFMTEFYWENVRAKSIRPGARAINAIGGAIIRVSNDLGRFAGNLKRLRINGLFERFDYFMTGESISFERKVARAKFLSLVILATALLLIFILRF